MAAQDLTAYDCLQGGGEMGALMRTIDWSETPIGPVQSWSQALRITVRTLLANRFPLLLWWGPDYIQIYNDAYRPIPGAKHPKSMGQPARECWSEIWHIIGPLVDTPFKGGPATWMDDISLEINRHGFLEETHFTIAYSPVPDETAPRGIGGVLATVNEVTDKVIGERRMVALRDLARAGEVKNAEEACAIAARTLAGHSKDVPFALIYLLDEGGKHARLTGVAGVAMGETISPPVVDLQGANGGGWPFVEALESEAVQVVEKLGERFAAVPPGPWSDPPNTAVVLPIPSSNPHRPAGVLVAGVSARLELDEFYRDFLGLVTTQVAAAIANARAYEEERKRAEALAGIDRAKTAFFSNVSHEFRTPLTLMLGPLEDVLSEGERLPPAHRESLETAHRNSVRLLKLVNTLLDFSRIEAGRIQAVFEPTDLAVLTAELASNFRSACQRAGLDLRVDCPPLSEPVYVDREMWEKVVLNLLSNAFKFTFQGHIQVALKEAREAVELSVLDTGTGIPEEEVPHVFERFFRARGTRGRTYEGTGIGLSLVQELVRLHGGSVRVESAVGEGSVFTVSIPLGREHLPPDRIGGPRTLVSTASGAKAYVEEALRWLPDKEAQPATAPPGVGEATRDRDAFERPGNGGAPREPPGRKKVLLADDNADMRDHVRRILERDYEVVTVPDGEAALALARSSAPDLILSDVMMPRLDGFALLRELRQDPKTRRLPVVLLSARAGEESRVEGLGAGADDYLTKPFSARELLARVSAHLELSRMRLESERALRESEQRLQAAYENAPVGICETDLDCRFTKVNQRFCEITGYTRDELLARRFQDITHPDDVEADLDSYRRLRAAEIPYYRMEMRYIHKDGPTVWIEVHSALVRDLDDTPSFGVRVIQDISAQVKARMALAEADRRKDEFLAVLAHELRNPLAPIKMASHILRMKAHVDTETQYVQEVIERQAGHLTRLVDDLLDVSRISQGKIELRRERVPISALVMSALETTRPLLDAGRHELVLRQPEKPLFVNGDPVRLSQVLANLLNNAAKYTHLGGKVWLTVAEEGGSVVLKVRDNGIGIPQEMLSRIFDMFTQVDRSLERTTGGLGIGLTLVRQLVEMHGGTVEAHSEGAGRGSEFVVTLPLAPPQESTRGPEATSPGRAGPPLMPLRILVVDDNRDAADALGRLLRRHRHEVSIAHEGLEALSTGATQKPDVVLLDIGLPAMNGHDVARRMREQPWGKKAFLVAVTGWGQEEDRRRSRESGFDQHLVKPLDAAALEALLRSYAESRV